jgi:Glycosyl hydrolase catalytic core
VKLVVLLFAVAACVAASSVQASSGVRYGIQDDAWLEYGSGTLNHRLQTFKRLGVPLVRFTIHWDAIARRRPVDPESPRDRAYDWRRSDRVLRGLRRYGLTPVVTLLGTPAWANGGRAPNYAPPHPRDFRAFARAVAARYPWVRYWLIWNEPNHPLWLRPTRAAIYVEHLLNPGYEGIHAVLPHAQVGGGVTAPRGGLGGVAPVTWIRGMAAAHAKLDAYAHHPYPTSPAETPSSHGCVHCPTITMATIRKLLILVRHNFGRKPIWLTEYGYQTNPPDTFLGVSPRKQATLLSLAALRAWRLPRVTMLIQYLYRDEPQLARFQTGLVYIDDRPKPSLNAFRLPFAEMRRSGVETVVWGQIRNGRSGRKRYRLEVLHRSAWEPVGHDRLTNDEGVFIRTIRLKRGALLRIWSPRQRIYSLRLRVR